MIFTSPLTSILATKKIITRKVKKRFFNFSNINFKFMNVSLCLTAQITYIPLFQSSLGFIVVLSKRREGGAWGKNTIWRLENTTF